MNYIRFNQKVYFWDFFAFFKNRFYAILCLWKYATCTPFTVCTGKVERSLVGETDCAKVPALTLCAYILINQSDPC